MAKIKTKIELDEKDLLVLIANHYNLDVGNSTINIYSYKGGSDPRERDYTTVTVEGVSSTRITYK